MPWDVLSGRRTLTYFKLYSPIADSLIYASCDAEKGETVQDQLETTSALEPARNRGALGHIPYVRSEALLDPSQSESFGAKSTWAFESCANIYKSRHEGCALEWEKPVRLRHVASGKYLSCQTSSNGRDAAIATDGDVLWYDAALVDDVINDAPPGAFGSAESMLFIVTAESDSSSGFLPQGVSSLVICHPYRNLAIEEELAGEEENESAVSQCFLFTDTRESKPEFLSGAKDAFKDLDESLSIVLDASRARGRNITRDTRPGKSFRVVFRSERDAGCSLKVHPISEEQTAALNKAKSFIPPLRYYARKLADASKPWLAKDEAIVVIDLLLSAIQFATKSKLPKETAEDWMRLLIETESPNTFVEMFSGVPNPSHQKLLRDCKILDFVFDLSLAPYVHAFPKSPWDAPKRMQPIVAVQRLCQIALQRIIREQPESEFYFSRRLAVKRTHPEGVETAVLAGAEKLGHLASHATAHEIRAQNVLHKFGSGKTGGQWRLGRWTDILLDQLEHPHGAAVTLAELVTYNEELMRGFVSPRLIQKFIDQIQTKGPEPRLLRFFTNICTVKNQPITANQELVLRMLWMHKLNHQRSLLDIVTIPSEGGIKHIGSMMIDSTLIQWHSRTPQRLGSGKPRRTPRRGPVDEGIINYLREDIDALTASLQAHDFSLATPESFLGKNSDGETELPTVGLKWSSSASWTPGKDTLFHSPEALALD